MKSITAVFAAVMMLFAPAAFAACPDITGPYCLFAGCWYQYEQAPSMVERSRHTGEHAAGIQGIRLSELESPLG